MLKKLEQSHHYGNEKFLNSDSFNSDEVDRVSSELYGIRDIVVGYEDEIKALKEEIKKLRANTQKEKSIEEFSTILKGINRRIEEFNYEPLDREDFESMFNQLDYLDTKLDKMEKSYEVRINELQYSLERMNNKKVQELKESIIRLKPTDPKITLHFLERELQKIEKVINQKEPEVWNIYTMTLFVMVGVFGMVGLLSYEPFSSLYRQLLLFLGL
jgi:chromosome segregation ATPase